MKPLVQRSAELPLTIQFIFIAVTVVLLAVILLPAIVRSLGD
ncbi:MAG: hypothetical protein RB292_00470 [Patescibacteria group bacterium]|jgi:hypothetical protein|nr:hypothetical protein [Patescibacteria group bacterium]